MVISDDDADVTLLSNILDPPIGIMALRESGRGDVEIPVGEFVHVRTQTIPDSDAIDWTRLRQDFDKRVARGQQNRVLEMKANSLSISE